MEVTEAVEAPLRAVWSPAAGAAVRVLAPPAANDREPASEHRRVVLFGMRIDAVTMPEAVSRILGWIDSPFAACRYVVTPNVDHVVRFQNADLLREAYANASLVVADGMPLVWASRWCGKPLPERVAGSDLVPAVLDGLERSRSSRVFLLGAAPGVAVRAAERIAARWPAVRIVGTNSPPPGFEHDRRAGDAILRAIARARPDLLLVGLGAPKQEIWISTHRRRIEAPVAMCVGATIDFLAGHRKRCPLWMRRAGLEWAYRLSCEPRRLAGRYALDAWVFPRLLWRELGAT